MSTMDVAPDFYETDDYLKWGNSGKDKNVNNLIGQYTSQQAQILSRHHGEAISEQTDRINQEVYDIVGVVAQARNNTSFSHIDDQSIRKFLNSQLKLSLDSSISLLLLPAYDKDRLFGANIYVIRDIVKKTRNKLINMVGAHTTSIIEEALAIHGFSIGMTIDDVGNKTILPDDASINVLNLSLRPANALREMGLTTIRAVTDKTGSELLRHVSFGRKSLDELRKKLEEHGRFLQKEKPHIMPIQREG